MRIMKNRKQRYRRTDPDRARVVSGFRPGRRSGRSATANNQGRGRSKAKRLLTKKF